MRIYFGLQRLVRRSFLPISFRRNQQRKVLRSKGGKCERHETFPIFLVILSVNAQLGHRNYMNEHILNTWNGKSIRTSGIQLACKWVQIARCLLIRNAVYPFKAYTSVIHSSQRSGQLFQASLQLLTVFVIAVDSSVSFILLQHARKSWTGLPQNSKQCHLFSTYDN